MQAFAFASPAIMLADDGDVKAARRTYLGLVVGRRRAAVACFFVDLVDFVAPDFFAAAAADVFFFFVERFRTVVVVPVVAATPDETRVECFVRCLTTFVGAAFA